MGGGRLVLGRARVGNALADLPSHLTWVPQEWSFETHRPPQTVTAALGLGAGVGGLQANERGTRGGELDLGSWLGGAPPPPMPTAASTRARLSGEQRATYLRNTLSKLVAANVASEAARRNQTQVRALSRHQMDQARTEYHPQYHPATSDEP